MIISSSRADQSSYYQQGGNLSIFTEHLLAALEGAANRPGETIVKVSHLISHLGERVPVTARETCGAAQTPWVEQASEDFPIALLYGGKGVSASHTAPTVSPSVDLNAVFARLRQLTEVEFNRLCLMHFQNWQLGTSAHQRLDQRITDLVEWAVRKGEIVRLTRTLDL
ncbi:MAG: hypothetical protein HC828_16775 [Blastochloris sp.]|nr:hypothetical protein [Blastochloris sp.]